MKHQRWLMVSIALLSVILFSTGCANPFGSSEATPAGFPSPVPIVMAPQISLDPSSGTAGTFVTVTGQGWKPSAMIVIRLADGEGLSKILAAVSTDDNGSFSTGFLYPIGDRWTLPGSYDVVVSLQDGEETASVPFIVKSPDEEEAAPTSAFAPTVTLAVSATPEPDETAIATKTKPPATATPTTVTTNKNEVPASAAMMPNSLKASPLASSGGKAVICHKGKKTLSVSRSAVPAHLAHGDYLGPCRNA